MFNPIFSKAKEGKTIEFWWTVLGEMSKQFSDADDLQSELAQVTLTCLSIINCQTGLIIISISGIKWPRFFL